MFIVSALERTIHSGISVSVIFLWHEISGITLCCRSHHRTLLLALQSTH